MKKIIFIFPAILIILYIISCDKLDPPFIKPEPETCPIPNMDSLFPVDDLTQKFLILDFTGHKCPGCPQAHLVINDLKDAYPGQIVAIAIHAGDFTYTDGHFTYDFTTPWGDELSGSEGLNIQWNPAGTVNSLNSDDVSFHTTWEQIIDTSCQITNRMIINMFTEYNCEEDKHCIHIQTKFLQDMTGEFMLCAYMIEDSIVEPQMVGSVEVQDYVHNHVLRDAINLNTWGQSIGSGAIPGGTDTIVSYAYTFDSTNDSLYHDENHCSAVAFVYDNATREVIQAAEEHLQEPF